jgi:hypothetical protein
VVGVHLATRDWRCVGVEVGGCKWQYQSESACNRQWRCAII